jgi:large subunit ribosomal protein L29
MKAKEIRERSDQELKELGQQLTRDLFGIRMKNYTGQLDDTSQLRKTRRDLARIALITGQRAREQRAAQQPSDQQAGSKS